MAVYAMRTDVPVERSKAEIERILTRYGAQAFAYAAKTDAAMVEFQLTGKRIRFVMPMPVRPTGDYRGSARDLANWEQGQRQKWRALSLVIKAKLEAVTSEITTIQQEFLAHIVVPGGRTFGDHVIPQLDEIYSTGKVPALSWEGR